MRADAGRCTDACTRHLVVTGDETLDFTLPQRQDASATSASVRHAGYVEADTGASARRATTRRPRSRCRSRSRSTASLQHGPRGDERLPRLPRAEHAASPTCRFRARRCRTRRSTRSGTTCSSTPPPASGPQVLGAAPNRTFVIEWRNVRFFDDLDAAGRLRGHPARERAHPDRVPQHRPTTAGRRATRRRWASRTRPARSHSSTRSTRP